MIPTDSRSAAEDPVAVFERAFACAVALVAAILLVAAVVIAVTLPYGEWDSLFFGTWSRLIGLHDGFHFAQVGAQDLHRPLFYVLQGGLWKVFGFHEALGRLLSLAFTVIFVASVVRIAYTWGGIFYGAAAGAVALAITDVAVHSSDGLTDVPAAAMIAVVAAVLFTMAPGRRRTALLVLTALLAVLAKPSGILGCVSLCAAEALGDRATLRARLRGTVAPIAGGVLLGLVYDWTQAHHIHMSLSRFLQSGVGAGIWAQKSAAARPEAIYGWMWLGRPLHILLIFGVAYGVLLVCRVPNTRAALGAAGFSWIWAWAGPAIAGHGFHAGASLSGLASYAVALGAPAAAIAAPDRIPSRLTVARLLIWALPSYLVWVEYAAYDTRLVSAAWPAVALLLGAAVVAILSGLERENLWAAGIVGVCVVLLALVNVVSLNGLGKAGWHDYRSNGISGLGNTAAMNNIALGQFEYELNALRPQLSASDRVFSEDARVGFSYPGRVHYDYPKSCSDFQGYRAFVELFSDESVAQAGSFDPTRCASLHLIASAPGVYAVYTLGPPRVAPTSTACTIPPPPSGLVAVFGAAGSEAAAQKLLDDDAHYGFEGLKIVQVKCNRFLILESGITTQQGRGMVSEAKPVHIHVVLTHLTGA